MLIERKVPITEQVRAILRQRIQDGEYVAEGRLPSEEQLAREFGVSRATVRTSLTALTAEGLLIRRQGDGTYVNREALTSNPIEVITRIESIWEFTHLIEESGRKASIQVLSCDERLATSYEAQALHLPSEEPVLSLERLFCADGQPVIRSSNVLSRALVCQEIDPLAAQLPIFEYLERYCNQSIAYAVADLSAQVADEITATLLNVPPGTALLQFEEIFFNQHGQPLVFALNLYNDKLLRLRVLRSQQATPTSRSVRLGKT